MTRNSPVGSVFAVVGFFSFIGLISSGFILRGAIRDTAGADETPQPIALRELIDNGPGGNRHVAVSGFRPRSNYVRSGTPGSNQSDVYVVLTPADGSGGNLIAVGYGVRQEAVGEVFGGPTVTGLYRPSGSLGREGAKLIRERYPDIDPDAAPYLDVRPWQGTRGRVIGGWVAGVSGALFVGSVLGIIWFVRTVKRHERLAAEVATEPPAGSGPPE